MSKLATSYGLSVGETQTFLQEIKRRSYVTKGEYHIEPLATNPADTVVLQAAVEGQATHIVTGDKKHLLPLKEIQDNKYDLSISRYRETEYEAAQYDPPKDILRCLRGLDDEVRQDLDELEGLLRQTILRGECL